MAARPNILVILTDQQRYDSISALGNSIIRTPHYDRVVREGTTFTEAYTPSPECVPARCSFTMGQYPARTGCYANGYDWPFEQKETLMAALARTGYYTHGVGKMHFEPAATAHELHGFHARERQEEIVKRPEHDDYLQYLWAHGYTHITDPHGVRGEMYYIPQPAQMPAALHPTQWVGDRAEAFLRARKRGDGPWFLFVSFVHPHPPFCPPAPWHKLYRDLDVPLPFIPPDAQRLWLFVNHAQNRTKRRDRGMDLNLLRVQRAYYYACVSFIDYQIGRMLAALEETGALDDTMIVCTTDHGELLGDYGCYGKRSYHDPVTRIPLVIRYPRLFEPGARCRTPASLLDVTATILELAGASFATHSCDGVSLCALAGGAYADRTVFAQLNQAGDGIYMAVNREWKYVYSAPDQRELLFDRVRDPYDTIDCAGQWQRSLPWKKAQEELRASLLAFLREAGETDALDGDHWRVYPKKTMPDNPDAGLLYQDHPWAEQFIPGYSRHERPFAS
ncbi:MAG: sulfatase-like hydrolase/transferase [bacterium]|nr:sulfatase-like hydrolase/transferase [bacterium]